MQGHWINSAPYYRCRFPAEYALANKLDHPRNVYLREDAFADPVSGAPRPNASSSDTHRNSVAPMTARSTCVKG